jgi:hypothetical protein
MGIAHSYPPRRVRVRGRSCKSTHRGRDNNLNSFHATISNICDTVFTLLLVDLDILIHILELDMRTAVLSIRFRLTTVRSQFALKRNSWLFFTGEYHRSRNVQNLKRWNNTLYWPAARVLRTHSCPLAFPPPPQSPWVTCWDHWWCHFHRRWKYCLGSGRGELVVFIVTKTRAYLKFILACNFSKAAFFWQSGWQISSLAERITHSLPALFFSLLNLSSVPFLPAYSFRPQNLASESLK